MPPPQFQGQKILITGASGFIGSHLCSRLIGSGAEVHVVSRIRRFGNDGGLIRWHGDMADTATVRTLFKTIKPDVIFHLAGHVAGSRNLDVVMPTFQSNLMSTVNILTSASEVGCRRIVLPGSLEEPEAGDLETVPSSPYAAAKWAGGAYARMFHKLYGLPVVILRIFMVYGPAQKDLNKLVPYVTLSLLRGESPKLTSGRRPVDWVYVEDVVEGLVASSRKSDIEGLTVDLGSGTLVSVREVAERIAFFTGSGAQLLFGALPDRDMEQVRAADIAGACAKLGWHPRTSLEEGLEKTVEWYRKHLYEKDSEVWKCSG